MKTNLSLLDMLPPSHILWQPECKSKKRVFEQVSILLETEAGLSRETVFTELIKRERLGTTALENHTAIPHIRLDGIKKPECVFVRLKKPIQYDAEEDGKSAVQTMFFLIAPEDANDLHLRLLGIFAEILVDENFTSQLAECAGPEDVHQKIAEWEKSKAEQLESIFSN